MNETTDYEKLLAELLEERANLDRMINWVRTRLGRTDTEQPATQVSPSASLGPMRGNRIATDAFFRMTVSEAIKAYLNIAKKPQSAREITDALIAGGLTFKAKNLYQTVFPTLSRMANETGEVAKLKDNTWGLAEWYSTARRAPTTNTTEEADK